MLAGRTAAAVAADDAVAGGGDNLRRFQSSEIHMGVDFTIVLYAADSEAANRAFRAAFDRIEELNGVIERLVEDPLAEALLRGDVKEGEPIHVDRDGDHLTFVQHEPVTEAPTET